MNKKRPLTDRDMETLGDLISSYDYMKKHGFDGIAPLHFGGSNGSHHGATAAKLAVRGFAEQRKRGAPWGESPKFFRGSKVYRPTQAGRDAFAIWCQAQKDGGDPIEIMGVI